MLADIKLRIAQLLNCKALTLGNTMDNLGKKSLLDLAVPWAKDVLPILPN